MSFLDDAKACEKVPYQICTVRRVLEELDEPLRSEVIEALRMPKHRLTGEAIATALQARGYEIDGQNVQRHRRRGCKCPDELR